MKTPKPPSHLSARARQLWRSLNQEYEFTGDALATLQVALENLDVADQARALVKKEGLVLGDKRHPAVGIMQHAHSAYLRAMKELALDVVEPNHGRIGRPPGGRV